MSTLENLVTSLQHDWKEFSTDFSAVFRHFVLGANQGVLDLLGIEKPLGPEEAAEKERLRLLETYSLPPCPLPTAPQVPPSMLPAGVEGPPIKTSGRYVPGPVETRASTIDPTAVYVKTRSYGYTVE